MGGEVAHGVGGADGIGHVQGAAHRLDVVVAYARLDRSDALGDDGGDTEERGFGHGVRSALAHEEVGGGDEAEHLVGIAVHAQIHFIRSAQRFEFLFALGVGAAHGEHGQGDVGVGQRAHGRHQPRDAVAAVREHDDESVLSYAQSFAYLVFFAAQGVGLFAYGVRQDGDVAARVHTLAHGFCPALFGGHDEVVHVHVEHSVGVRVGAEHDGVRPRAALLVDVVSARPMRGEHQVGVQRAQQFDGFLIGAVAVVEHAHDVLAGEHVPEHGVHGHAERAVEGAPALHAHVAREAVLHRAEVGIARVLVRPRPHDVHHAAVFLFEHVAHRFLGYDMPHARLHEGEHHAGLAVDDDGSARQQFAAATFEVGLREREEHPVDELYVGVIEEVVQQ